MKAKEFIEYLNDWKQECENGNHFISDKLHFDLKAMVFGLEQMVIIKKKAFPRAELKPVIINQDVVENIFCQVRSFNGQNVHPNYQLYMNTINTVNITQTMASKRQTAETPRVCHESSFQTNILLKEQKMINQIVR